MKDAHDRIIETLKTLPAARNSEWEKSFLALLPQCFVTVVNPEPQTGPDNWPYLFIEVSDRSDEPCSKVIEWLTDRGIGLAVNPGKAIPDYVLTYGMLCNYRMTGNLLTEVEDFGPTELVVQGNQIFVAEPNENYLPPYLRSILLAFFRDQKISKPRLTLLSSDKKVYDMAFSIESLGSPPAQEHAGISEAIAWFLPAHYGIVLVSEKRISGFVNL